MEKTLIENVKEGFTYTGIAVGFAYGVKKMFKIIVLPDPTVKNVIGLGVITTGAVYVRNYLIKEKILPS